jgi:tRNA-guanine family transglycosylase
MAFSFSLIKKDNASSARLGKITTDHGAINTVFMPVGTQATVKTLARRSVSIGAEILSNTYHLFLAGA